MWLRFSSKVCVLLQVKVVKAQVQVLNQNAWSLPPDSGKHMKMLSLLQFLLQNALLKKPNLRAAAVKEVLNRLLKRPQSSRIERRLIGNKTIDNEIIKKEANLALLATTRTLCVTSGSKEPGCFK
mmetsp:Transcript_81549/g.162756  ORF Transcript_81549/g.162756 Transcript_81549/m.162756 type:complete len:125 (+) Transcript_81549:130-504(+)